MKNFIEAIFFALEALSIGVFMILCLTALWFSDESYITDVVPLNRLFVLFIIGFIGRLFTAPLTNPYETLYERMEINRKKLYGENEDDTK